MAAPHDLEAVAATIPGDRAAVVVAARTPHGTATLCRGFTDGTRTTSVTDRTVFEIGSVTKTFTALLLAEMTARGQVRLDDRLHDHLPPWAIPGGRHGRDITLHHLATHTAGLPRLPPGLYRTAPRRWYSNPYWAFSPQDLLRSTARVRVRRPPGTRVRYSNLGIGLLGHLLAETAAIDYGTLLRARVLDPLGLADTTHDPTLVPDRERAIGHWRDRPRPPFVIPGLPGAGTLRSSATDLLSYLRAHLSPDVVTTPEPAMRTALRQVLRASPAAPGGPEVCLVWSRHTFRDHVLYFHGGATRGFTSFIGFSPQADVCLVALASSAPTLRDHFIQSAYTLLHTLAGRPWTR